MQVKDILDKLRSLEEADEKKSEWKPDPTSLDGEEGDKPKPKWNNGLDGEDGDKPKPSSSTPGPVQAASEPTADNNGGSKANNDAGGLAGAAAAAGAAIAGGPDSPAGKQVQKDLGGTDDPNPEIQKLVTALDSVDKFLKKYGVKVEPIAESVYNYYRTNINDFLTPQEQIKTWSILSEDNGKQKLDEFLGMFASRMASRAMARQLARRMAARQARQMAARNASRMASRNAARNMAGRSMARSAARHELDMVPGVKQPWWKSPWVKGAGIVGSGIMLAPVIKDLWKGLKDMFGGDEQQPQMMPQTGPEEDPNKKDPNKPTDPNNPNGTDPAMAGIPREELIAFMKNMDIIRKFSSDQTKIDGLPETIKIRLTNTIKAVTEFMEKAPSTQQ
jgi:hypothetical protein